MKHYMFRGTGDYRRTYVGRYLMDICTLMDARYSIGNMYTAEEVVVTQDGMTTTMKNMSFRVVDVPPTSVRGMI